MADPRRPEDIRDTTENRSGPRTGSGGGAAYRGGYGAGGLGSGAERLTDGEAHAEPPSWDAPGVTPAGRRTGSPDDGPRIAMSGEGEPDADPPADDDQA
jgi:hypothetical protein